MTAEWDVPATPSVPAKSASIEPSSTPASASHSASPPCCCYTFISAPASSFTTNRLTLASRFSFFFSALLSFLDEEDGGTISSMGISSSHVGLSASYMFRISVRPQCKDKPRTTSSPSTSGSPSPPYIPAICASCAAGSHSASKSSAASAAHASA